MLLYSELVNVSSSAVVTLLPPGDSLPEVSGINLYLYRVLESPFTKNQPWNGDRVTPPSDQPALGLQLSYLLTPLGTKPDDSSFQLGDDAHTMLGVAMTTLHENPILNNVHIPPSGASPGFDADTVLPDFLLNSYEQVKITLLPTNLEELSKIWATINQPYRLSVAYEVSLVELTPTPPPPVDAGIVMSTGLTVLALSAPQLNALTPVLGALVHIAGGQVVANQLTLNGSGFSFPGQTPTVTVGGQAVTLASAPPPTDQSLAVILPTDLDAGAQADVRATLNSRTSVPLTFNISPWLASMTPIRTALDPTQAQDLTLVLQGNGFTTTPGAVRFDGPSGTTSVTAFLAGGTDKQAKVTIPTTLPNGIYNIRLVLGDVATDATNSRALQVIPLLNSPIGLAVVVVSGKSVHKLTLNGARLNGSDARILIDGITYQTGANASATQLVYTLGRLLDAGAHDVSVNVDGQNSRAVGLEV
jgi:hypothetical protein